jgi:hypothetical protein
MYEDLMRAVEGADLLVTGEVVFSGKIGCRANRHQMDFDESRADFFFLGARPERLPDGAVVKTSARFTRRFSQKSFFRDALDDTRLVRAV